jgi:hypothetical protein
MRSSTRNNGKIRPGIALALLNALRAVDTPDETLEDEAFHRSLPRRLGLSDVIGTQMRRYAEMSDRGGALEASELQDLLRLIGRRPDARQVYDLAGRRLATDHLQGRFAVLRMARRVYPERLRRRLLLRCMARAARALSPGAAVSRSRQPLSLSIEGGILAGADDSGAACEVLTGAATVCAQHLWHGVGVSHSACQGRGDERCVWAVSFQPA